MVGTGSDGSYSMLARACVVNHHGHVLYDSFVAPMDKITDYRTAISGVSPKDLRGGVLQYSLVSVSQVGERRGKRGGREGGREGGRLYIHVMNMCLAVEIR